MVVAFIGHREIGKTKELVKRLSDVITSLIVQESADTFLFGSKSEFDSLCHSIVSTLKEIYPHIQRVYVRAEYEFIDTSYTDYLLTYYEKTLYPKQVHNSGKLSYVKRNQVMVDRCDVLVTYCDPNYNPPQKNAHNTMSGVVHAQRKNKSGTVFAVTYAQQRKKQIINLFENS